MNIGLDIKLMRVAKGVKQKELARNIGVTPEYLCAVEAGKYPLCDKLYSRILALIKI